MISNKTKKSQKNDHLWTYQHVLPKHNLRSELYKNFL